MAENTFTGAMTVSAGTLRYGADNILSDASGLIVAGGILDMVSFSDTFAAVSLRSGAISGNGTVTSTSDFDARSGTIGVALAGTVGLIKTGDGSAGGGTVTLSGANTYTGTTTVESGTLAAGGAANRFSAASAHTLTGAGATLALCGFNQTIGSLAGVAGSVVTNSAPAAAGLTVGGDNTSTLFAGILQNGNGALSLTKVGTGTLTLSGANTYSGITRIEAGTLALGANNVLADATAVEIAGGTLALGTFTDTVSRVNMTSGSIASGTGSALVVTGTYTQSGGSLAAGATVNAGGMLNLSGGTIAGSLSTTATSNLGNPAAVVNGNVGITGSVNASGGFFGVGSVGGATLAITGGGQVRSQTGLIAAETGHSGTVLLSGPGSLWHVTNGLGIGWRGAGSLTLADGAGITGGGVVIAAAAASSGIFNFGAAEGQAAAATGTLSGNISFGPGTGTMVFNHTATDFTLASNIRGNGAIRHLAGTTTLSGAATGFTGSTTLTGGTLLVNGSLGGTITVNGGTLGGTGSLGNVIIGSGGFLNPGQSPGTILSVSLTLDAGSTTTFELGEAGVVGGANNDLIVVTGNLALNGGSFDVVRGAGFGSGRYTLIQFDTLSGALGNLTLNPLGGGFLGNLAVDGNAVIMDVAAAASLVWWNGSITSPTGTLEGGSGTWSLTNTNFTDAGGAVSGPWAGDGSMAMFGGTAGTVTIEAGASVAPSSIGFVTDGYVIAGGDAASRLELAGAVGIDTAIGVGATISAIISGTGSLTKTGDGTLTLTRDNLYGGGTTILGGTLLVGSDDALGSGSLAMLGGTTFGNSASGVTIDRDIGFAGGVFLPARPVTQFTLAGDIAGSGGITKTGGGELLLSGDNTFTGGITVDEGRLTALSDRAFGDNIVNVASAASVGFSGVSIANDFIIDGDVTFGLAVGSGASTLSGGISGSGNLRLFPADGRIVLTGDNTYSGITTIVSGIVQVGNGGTTGRLGDGTIVNQGTLIFNRSNDLTVANGIIAEGSLVKQGTGTMTLTGNSSYSGTTTISGGTLAISRSANIGDSSATNRLIIDGGTLRTSGTIVMDRAVTIGASGGTMDIEQLLVLNDPVTFSGRLTKDGDGRLTLFGANSGAGGINLLGGSIEVNNSNALGTGTLDMATGTTLLISRSGLTFGNNIVLGGGAGSNIDPFNTVNPLTLTGTLSGKRLNVVGGAGKIVLTGTNTYSETSIAAGNALIVGNGGTTGTLGTGAVTNNGALVFNRSNALAVANVISGSGTVTQAGSGTTTLTANNTYTGLTRITGGTLAVVGGSLAGSVVNDATFVLDGRIGGDLDNNATARIAGQIDGAVSNDGAITLTGDAAILGRLTQGSAASLDLAGFDTALGSLAGGGTIALVGGDLSVGSDDSSTTFGGVISGQGRVFTEGLGTLTLTGVNTFTGLLTVAGGGLNLASGGALASNVSSSSTSSTTARSAVLSAIRDASPTTAPSPAACSATVSSRTAAR